MAEGIAWATDIMETSALISGILSVCHPELYSAGIQCMEHLAEDEDYSTILGIWSSMFNGVSIISN